MKEEDAKQKRCCGPVGCGALIPVTDVMEPGLMGARVDAADSLSPRWCVGSGCMAWRWKDEMAFELKEHGYCGLAGREGGLYG